MKLGSNCFLINCDLALTMRKICRVVAINEYGHYRYIIEPQDQPRYLISALEYWLQRFWRTYRLVLTL